MRPSLVLFCVLTLSACGTASSSAPMSGPVLGEVVVVQGDRSAEVAYERPLIGADRGRAQAGDRRLVRTADLGLEVRDGDAIPGVLDAAAATAEALGGYVAAEEPRAMTLRIPDARLDEALDALGSLAKETRRAVRVADVTDQYTDLEIRLANARALRDRLEALLAQATTVTEVLEVERELSRVTTEVERLDGQLRSLADRVALSTVRLTVADGVRPGPVGYVLVGVYEVVKWLFVRD